MRTTDTEVPATKDDERPTESAELEANQEVSVDSYPDEAPDGPPRESVGADGVDAQLVQQVEALLFSTHHPLTASRIADVLQLPSAKPIKSAVAQLNTAYRETGRCFQVEQVAGGYQLLTLPEFGDIVATLNKKDSDAKLTNAAQETLAIIAYKQPILRTDVEAIRGVGCGETIRSLMEKRLVKIAGRSELPGRPILYGTTRRFLEVFGLNTLKDLPKPEGEAK